MKRKLLACTVALFSVICSNGQFTENFSDGDFSNNPAWVGLPANWIINPLFQLQSNNTVANSTFYLSTISTLALTAQWDFTCKLGFNPSSVNYMDVFVTASDSDLSQPSTTGYFVRIGGTDDEVSLYRKDNGSVTKIIDGINGLLNSSSIEIRISLIREASNQWKLTRNLNTSGSILEGATTDATYLTASYFGILVKQSTAGFFQKHFIDDITAGPFIPDILPPVILSSTVTGNNTLDILFNEPVDMASCQVNANYMVNNGIGFPVNVTRDIINPALVHLAFTNTFPNRINLTVTINAVTDLSGNALNNATSVFNYFTAIQYDVVIDELMADPTPVVALPDAEWIELKNTTAFNIDLRGWRLGKPSGQSGPMPAYILKPDSMVIVCAGSSVTAMSAYGPVISVTSFPALGNTGDLLYLLSPQGRIIHTVSYSDDWYQNELKKDGGFTLEMVDTHNPCSGIANWLASVDDHGGTPGKRNAADGLNADESSPKLLRAYATDSVNIVLLFNETLDSVQAANVNSYIVSEGIGSPAVATALPFLFNRVNLQLTGNAALQRNKIYTVTANSVADCSGNVIGTDNTARVGLYEPVDSTGIVINEILFNPHPSGNDYVEMYNRSDKIFNIKNTYLANRNSTGVIAGIRQLIADDYLFFPGDFLVVTEKSALVLNNYVAMNPDAFIEITGMPSYNDDEGDVIILDEHGNIIDEVVYSEKWHFKLISEKGGISLERIDYNAASQEEKNWHSAATSVGYGTPTYKNSQLKVDAGVTAEISVTPEIVSPDNDGMDDFAVIRYSFPEPGYVSNVTIFDATGRPVRYLERNTLNGSTGYYRWDGLGEKNQQLPVGIYIIYTEVFNLDGKSKKFRNVIVLARKTN